MLTVSGPFHAEPPPVSLAICVPFSSKLSSSTDLGEKSDHLTLSLKTANPAMQCIWQVKMHAQQHLGLKCKQLVEKEGNNGNVQHWVNFKSASIFGVLLRFFLAFPQSFALGWEKMKWQQQQENFFEFLASSPRGFRKPTRFRNPPRAALQWLLCQQAAELCRSILALTRDTFFPSGVSSFHFDRSPWLTTAAGVSFRLAESKRIEGLAHQFFRAKYLQARRLQRVLAFLQQQQVLYNF